MAYGFSELIAEEISSELVQYEQAASRLAAMRGPERLFKNQEISDALTDLSEGVKMSCERTNVCLIYSVRDALVDVLLARPALSSISRSIRLIMDKLLAKFKKT